MIEAEIANVALENLQNNTHIMGEWKNYATKKSNDIDGEIVLNIDGQKIKLFIEIKKELRGHQLYRIEEIAKANKPFMLVAEHIFPKIKEELKRKQIAYLETNGNIYLTAPGIYLWVDSSKPVQQEKEKINRAFTKTGLKTIFSLLQNDEMVNYPYRDIAQITGIGLGNVSNVINGLKQQGFLLNVNKDEYKLVNKMKILEKWMMAYAEKLQPALLMGRFRFLKEEDQKNWKQIPIATDKTQWGGEPAADILTNYLKPEILTLYTEESRNDLIKNYRLVPDEKGKVRVYRKFWTNDSENRNTVDPMLVYVDLMNTGDGRCIETAQKIYNEFLQDKF